MKKGNVFPRTRARWQSGAVPAGGQNCPCWCRPASTLVATYLREEDGEFFIQPVLSDICTPARWQYESANGSIWWIGMWNDGFNVGTWSLQQQALTPGVSLCIAEIDLIASAIHHRNPPLTNFGTWATAGFFQVQPGTVDVHDSPWITFDATFTKLNYAAVRDIGEDSDDTSPLTWSGPVYP